MTKESIHFENMGLRDQAPRAIKEAIRSTLPESVVEQLRRVRNAGKTNDRLSCYPGIYQLMVNGLAPVNLWVESFEEQQRVAFARYEKPPCLSL